MLKNTKIYSYIINELRIITEETLYYLYMNTSYITFFLGLFRGYDYKLGWAKPAYQTDTQEQ